MYFIFYLHFSNYELRFDLTHKDLRLDLKLNQKNEK